MSEINYIGKASPEQLEGWKAKWGKVLSFEQVDPKDDNTVHVTYVKKPNLAQVQRAFTKLAEDPIAGGRMLLQDCHLGGSQVAIDDEEYSQGLASKMPGLFKPVQAALKEV